MDSKSCRTCRSLKPLEEFYPDISYPDGRKASCKVCHLKRAALTRRRRRLAEALSGAHAEGMGVQELQLAIELLAFKWASGGGAALEWPILVSNAIFPVKNGIVIEDGFSGPTLTYQTPEQRVKVSLAMTPTSQIAAEMAKWGVRIPIEGIEPPPEGHALAKAALLLRKRKGTS